MNDLPVMSGELFADLVEIAEPKPNPCACPCFIFAYRAGWGWSIRGRGALYSPDSSAMKLVVRDLQAKGWEHVTVLRLPLVGPWAQVQGEK